MTPEHGTTQFIRKIGRFPVAEEKMPTSLEWRERLGLERDEVIGWRLVNCYKVTVSVHGERDPRSYG